VPVAVIEKGRVAGAHQLSGAVMNPAPIRQLLGGEDTWPHFGEVGRETVYLMLNRKRALPLKPTPPPFRNHGNYIVSVAELNRWLGERAEEAGAYVLAETAGAKLLVDERSDDEASGRGRRTVVGVRTGDKGRDKQGAPKSNFEPGTDVIARATVLAEGCWGHLTGAALKGLGLASSDPQVWALGVKEVWEVEQPLDRVIHTLGWPLRPQARFKEFGGSWIYPMNRDGERPRVSVGFVAGLDYADARLSVHDVLQEFKLHPLVRRILAGGKRVAWGAKAIPEGGYWAMPRLHAPGMVICGDGGGMVNVPKLKGIHYAIRSGMLAAETLYSALKSGSTDFSAYERAVHDSEIGKDLYESRNMKQPFARGLFVGGAITNAMVVSKGRLPGGHWPTHRDADQPLMLTDRHKRYPKPDGKYTFDKLSSVFATGNATRDDAPSHIRIAQRVPRELAEAWAWMCPAAVYELPPDAPHGSEHVELLVNPSNCVQCGAITAKGGRLTPPEGGDGPVYQIT
jgi:electron-transferring-flavoprotein dehydrogenase